MCAEVVHSQECVVYVLLMWKTKKCVDAEVTVDLTASHPDVGARIQRWQCGPSQFILLVEKVY